MTYVSLSFATFENHELSIPCVRSRVLCCIRQLHPSEVYLNLDNSFRVCRISIGRVPLAAVVILSFFLMLYLSIKKHSSEGVHAYLSLSVTSISVEVYRSQMYEDEKICEQLREKNTN
jgi:hypothetical protein